MLFPPPAGRSTPAGVFLWGPRYTPVTEAGYVFRRDDDAAVRADSPGPVGRISQPRTAVACAAGREHRGPGVPGGAHLPGARLTAAPRRLAGAAHRRRMAVDPALRSPLPVDLGVGPGGGRLWGGPDDLRHARLVAARPADRRAARLGRGDLSHGIRPQVAAAAGHGGRRTPGGDPERGVRPVGHLRVDSVPARLRRAPAPRHLWVAAVF